MEQSDNHSAGSIAQFYAPRLEAYDEMYAGQGEMLPHWQSLMQELDQLGRDTGLGEDDPDRGHGRGAWAEMKGQVLGRYAAVGEDLVGEGARVAIDGFEVRRARQRDRVGLVTFDDGTDDFCDVVVPALVEYGIPATLYAATHFIDRGEAFPWGAAPASWAGLRDAASAGLVTIGSHTHTHALLDRLAPDAIADELEPLTFLDLDHGIVNRHLEREARIRRSGPIAENLLRDIGTVAAKVH